MMNQSFQEYLDANLIQNQMTVETDEGPIIIAVVQGEVVPMVFRQKKLNEHKN